MTRVTLKVDGMTCGHCVKAVTQALEDLDGVHDVHVDLAGGTAQVDYDEALVTARELESAVLDEGYAAEVAA
jgi:copper chaperone